MELFKIETGNFMVDGGAMFGVVPKSLWEKKYPVNEQNLCNFSMRSLLIVSEGRKILIDAGIGNKQDEKFFGHYNLNGSDSLKNSLEQTGNTPDGITDVVLSHLHFDHCGGAVEYNENNKLITTFKNARYWISRQQWAWAVNPNQREKASFLKENFLPIEANGQLEIIDKNFELVPGVELRLYNGHTEGQIIPFIKYNNKTIVFLADLIPTSVHIPLSWICGYDTKPLVSLDEKKEFLEQALANNYTLFFEHDINVECCSLKMTEKGIRPGNTYTLKDFLSD
ncbi:MAG: MBL fold metallo-hydrolase [Bacteroidales bacterium]|nr:MAG: MBL fold metallo-hydrolase [Bacteroidales bacterium]